MSISDVLTIDDIDFLIGSCMSPRPNGNDHVEKKNNQNNLVNHGHVDYNITELVADSNQKPNANDRQESHSMPFSEGKLHLKRHFSSTFTNYGRESIGLKLYGEGRGFFQKNEANVFRNDVHHNYIPTMVTTIPYQSPPTTQEQPSQSNQDMRKKPKRYRTAFSATQMLALEREYQATHYLPKVRRAELAVDMGIPEQTIKVWFQNRRMKTKREVKGQRSSRGQFIGDTSKHNNQWPMYHTNCGLDMQHQQHGFTDIKPTIGRW